MIKEHSMRTLALLALAGCLVFTGVGIAAEHGAPKKAEKSEKKETTTTTSA